MSNLLVNANASIDGALDFLLSLFHNIPGIVFIILIPIGFIFLFFGFRIYRIVLAVFFAFTGGFAGYLISKNIFVTIICAIAFGGVAALLQFVCMIIFAGLAFGLIAFAAMAMYFQGIASLIGAIISTILMVIAAINLFRLAVILSTSSLGSSLIIFSILVLKEQRRIFRDVNLTKLELDCIQFLTGFISLMILGIIIQGIIWQVKGKEE